MQLLNTIDDTLAAYINRAQYTLDIAIYNLDNSAPASTIINAINNAYSRGVRIRLIYESSNSPGKFQTTIRRSWTKTAGMVRRRT